MSVFIASVIIIIIASAYATLLKRKLTETIFLSATTIIFVLYCFGLINKQGCLLYGIYAVILFALICLTYLIYKQIKKYILKDVEILQGTLMYLFLLSFSLIINYGMVFHNWDEFSHWGIVVKYFFSVNAFATFRNSSLSGIMAPQYFPGISLFQYFFSRFDTNFVEYYSYIAKNIFYFSLFMPLTSNLFSKNKWIRNVFFLFIFILVPMQGEKELFYSSLYVDELLGIFFGFTLIYYFVYKYEKSIYGILLVTASTFMTTITKDIGLLLSLGCILIIMIDIFLYRRAEIKSFILNKSSLSYKTSAISLLSLPLVMTFFVKLTWALLLLRTGLKAGGYWKQPSLHDVMNLVLRKVEPYQKETVRNFVSAVFNRNINPFYLSIFWFCGIFLLIVFIFALYKRKQITLMRIFSSAFIIAIGAGIYQIVLMIMYVFSFSPYEAVILASYERYTFSYILGMIYFIFIFFFIDNDKYTEINVMSLIEKIKTSYKIIINKFSSDDAVLYKDIIEFGKLVMKILFLTFCSIMILIMYKYSNTGINSIIKGRTYLYKFTRDTTKINKWKPYLKGKKLYLIIQGDNGFFLGRLYYELKPFINPANLGYDYSIRPISPLETTIEDDMYNYTVTPDEWQKYVMTNEFDSIYVFRSDNTFNNAYSQFFPYGVVDDMLYNVTYENGKMLLIPVK
jgi:hypothetical protein